MTDRADEIAARIAAGHVKCAKRAWPGERSCQEGTCLKLTGCPREPATVAIAAVLRQHAAEREAMVDVDGETEAWIICFDEAGIADERFSGYGATEAALRRYANVSQGYNCHLFRKADPAVFRSPAAPQPASDPALDGEASRG